MRGERNVFEKGAWDRGQVLRADEGQLSYITSCIALHVAGSKELDVP